MTALRSLSRTRRRSAVRAAATIAFAAIASRPTSAQVLRIQAGTSSIYGTSGASVQVDSGPWNLSFGAGSILGRPVGTFLVRRHDGTRTLSFGDDELVVGSPTAAGDRSTIVAVRGAGVSFASGPLHVTAFAGAAASELGAPFLRASTYQAPLGILLLDRPLGPNRSLFSRTIVSDRLTSMTGVQWNARPDLTLSGAAGVVANAAAASARATLRRSWIDVDAALARASAWGTATGVDSIDDLAPGRTSLSAAIHPEGSWSMRAARQDFAATSGPIVTLPAATVTRLSGDWTGVGFRLSGAIASSTSQTFANRAFSVGAGHALVGGADAQVDVYMGQSGDGPLTTSLTATARTPFGPRFSLLEFFTDAGGHPAISLGATVTASALSLTVGYQTVFTPLRPDGPFVRALMVDVRTYAPGGFALNWGTHVAPDGHVRYTVAATRVLARGGGDHPNDVTLAPFVVRGRVLDDAGRPVARAVVQVDREVLLTDDDGRFAVHMARQSACAFGVLVGEFPPPGPYEIVQAPATVRPARDTEAADVDIRVRRKSS